MLKKLLLISIIIFVGITSVEAVETYSDVIIKNIGIRQDYNGNFSHYNGFILMLDFGSQVKWVSISRNLNQHQVQDFAIWMMTNAYKATVVIDSISEGYPELQYIKLNASDFE